MPKPWRTAATLAVALHVGVSCRTSQRATPEATVTPRSAPDAQHANSQPAPGRYPFTPADVHFMSGMIPHHAQAVLIAGWAPSHGASAAVRTLCERIVVAQRDEIATMQTWLRDHQQTAPDANAKGLRMTMGGMEHEMLMPGMLTDEQLAELDKSSGTSFDRLFLSDMIRHHEGAITMVNELFSSAGAAQDEVVFRFASDVYADQTTEIERMQKMLAALPGGGS